MAAGGHKILILQHCGMDTGSRLVLNVLKKLPLCNTTRDHIGIVTAHYYANLVMTGSFSSHSIQIKHLVLRKKMYVQIMFVRMYNAEIHL